MGGSIIGGSTPNKGHFGSRDFVPYLETVLWWEIQINVYSLVIINTIAISTSAIASVLCAEVVLWWEGPLYIYNM